MSESSDSWSEDLRRALVDLGVPVVTAQRLCAEADEEARSHAVHASDLYGPPRLYATRLRTALQPTHDDGPPSTADHTVLQLRGVAKRYRRRLVISDVDLTVHAGEVVAITGANGSGKSTLLRICAGLTRASAGDVRRVRRIGYVPQDGGLAGLLTANEHLRLVGAMQGMASGRAIATGTQLAGCIAWRPTSDVVVHNMSGGTRQKLNLVLGELGRPDLLLLDEPYQGFDQGSYLDFWREVVNWRDAGAGVVVVTHLLHELDRADRVLELPAREEGR